MGYSLSWLAIRLDAGAAHARLALEATSNAVDPGDAPFVGGALPGGWYLVAAQGCDHEIVSDAFLHTASAGASAVACSVEEHVMFCSAAAWSGGRELWRVSHAGDRDIRSLDVRGEPPPELAAIRDAQAAKQDAEGADPQVDWYFEIPLLLAQRISGFKHDEELPAGAGGFVELRAREPGSPAPPRPGRPWWRFW
jgi:hypothetical protein